MVDALNRAMRHAERVMGGHIRAGNLGVDEYKEFVALVDAAARLPDADAWAAGIEGLRFTGTLVYNRSAEEVEQAMRSALAPLPPTEVMSRVHTTGAAYATYPQLRPYFDREVAALEAMPESELRTNLLKSAARVRANVARKFPSTE